MVISDLKELKKLLQLGRSEGLESLKIDNIEIKFGTKPVKQAPKPRQEAQASDMSFDPGRITVQALDPIDTEEMTPDQLLFGSSDPSVWHTEN